MSVNIVVKIVVGENAINKLQSKFLVPQNMIENRNTLIFDKNKVKNISMQNRSTSNSEKFSLGVVSLMGNVEVKDFDNYLFYLTTNKLIGENTAIEIYNGSKLLNIFYTTKDWQYSNQNKQVSIELKGKISKWADIPSFGIRYQENVSALDILTQIIGITIEEGETITIKDDLATYLSRINFAKAYIGSGSLEEVWNKFCYATLLVVYEMSGKIIIERF